MIIFHFRHHGNKNFDKKKCLTEKLHRNVKILTKSQGDGEHWDYHSNISNKISCWWFPSSRQKLKKSACAKASSKIYSNVIWKIILRNRVGFESGTCSTFNDKSLPDCLLVLTGFPNLHTLPVLSDTKTQFSKRYCFQMASKIRTKSGFWTIPDIKIWSSNESGIQILDPSSPVRFLITDTS